MNHVVLVGFMGSGKSTAGRALASRLGRPFVDLDQLVVSREGMSVVDLFSAKGEAGFRDAESRALAEVVAMPPSVVACGGGVVLREENRALLGHMGTVFFLQVDAESVFSRVSDPSTRPLLAAGDVEAARRLMDERDPLYREVANHIVDTAGNSPSEVAAEIESLLEGEGL